MHQRLSGRRRSRRATAGSGNLWLRSDLRAPAAPQPQGRREPGRFTRPPVRSWMTWTLFGALLVTTAAAGHGFLATEPVVPSVARTVAPIGETAQVPLPQSIANTASTLPALYALEDTQQQLITQVEEIQAANRALLSRLESLQAALAPEDPETATR